jgi:DNA polymerase-3 subunit gamma/tau
MENFIVSARKYRPASFATVIGQASITNTLKNAIRNQQIAQAFLFTGPRGVGKTTCARILAKTINCRSLTPDGEACNECESCLSFNKSSSFNIYELDAASNNSVDDIRNLVDQVRIPPQSGKYKVYIIDEVHMLSAAAFNAFLKTLEEPPAYAKFILATTEKHKILPTILSRCQIFDFRRIGVEDIAHHLAWVAENEHVNADPDALHIIAQKADGGLRDALSMFDQLVSFAGDRLTYKQVIDNLNVLDYDYYFRITDFILEGNISRTLLTVNEIIDNGFDGQHFITGLGNHLRNLLVCRDEETVGLLETSANIRNLYLNQSTACRPDFLLKALDLSNNCDLSYKTSNNKRLHLEIALLQLCNLASPVQPPAGPRGAAAMAVPKEPAPASKPVDSRPKPQEQLPLKTLQEPESGIPAANVNKAAEPLTSYPVKTTAPEGKESPAAVRTYTGVNIGNLMKPGSGAADPAEENTSAQEPEVLPPDRENFTQSDLELVWKPMAESVAKDSPNLFNTLTCRIPVLTDGFKVIVTVDNKIQDSEIFGKRTEILGYLRKELRNWGIQLETHVTDRPVESRKPYTDQEKFNAMAERNPAIKTLKDQLNLDIEM